MVEVACSNVPIDADRWHIIQDNGTDYIMIATFFTKSDEIIHKQISDIMVYFTQRFLIPSQLKINKGLDFTIKDLKELNVILS